MIDSMLTMMQYPDMVRRIVASKDLEHFFEMAPTVRLYYYDNPLIEHAYLTIKATPNVFHTQIPVMPQVSRFREIMTDLRIEPYRFKEAGYTHLWDDGEYPVSELGGRMISINKTRFGKLTDLFHAAYQGYMGYPFPVDRMSNSIRVVYIASGVWKVMASDPMRIRESLFAIVKGL